MNIDINWKNNLNFSKTHFDKELDDTNENIIDNNATNRNISENKDQKKDNIIDNNATNRNISENKDQKKDNIIDNNATNRNISENISENKDKKDKKDKKDSDDDISARDILIAVIIAGFSWVVAIAWTNFMESVFKKYYPHNHDSVLAKFIYFFIITFLAVILIYLVVVYIGE